MLSPLRYPGGKVKLFPIFSRLIGENELYNRVYAEPYAGGAGLALKLLNHGFVQQIELNDADPAIAAFWRSVIRRPNEFCRLIEGTDISVLEWRRQREIYNEGLSVGELSLGFAAYFLNRTSRSGIIEGSGPIGGYSQESQWKIDARFNRKRQIEQIQTLSQHRDRIQISCEDAKDFLKYRLKDLSKLIYLDPPYYVKGSKLYKNFYCHDDHVDISNLLRSSREGCWILSYDAAPEIVEIYRDFSPTFYSLNYSAGSYGQGTEVIYSSDSIRLPDFGALASAA